MMCRLSRHFHWLLYDWVDSTPVELIVDLAEAEKYYHVRVCLLWSRHYVEVIYTSDVVFSHASVCFQNYGLNYKILDEKIADEVLDKIQEYLKGCTFIRELESWVEGERNEE